MTKDTKTDPLPSKARTALFRQQRIKTGLPIAVGLVFMLWLTWFLGGWLFLLLGAAFTVLAPLLGLLVSAIWVKVAASRRAERRLVRQAQKQTRRPPEATEGSARPH